MTRHMPPWLIAVLVLLALAGWIASGYLARGGAEPAAASSPPAENAPAAMRVQVSEQQARTITRWLVLQGQSYPDRRVSVRAETGGRIAAPPLAKGRPVAAGASIARIAMNDRRARLAEARARVEQREAEAAAARRLADRGYQSSTERQAAEAALAAARAELASIREEIANTDVRAPFDGILESVAVEEGDYLAVGGEVAEVVDLDPLRVTVFVAQQDIARVSEGTPARVRFATGAERGGQVDYVAATADEETRTFRVEVAVPNGAGDIPAGVSATVRLPADRVSAHFVSPAVLTLGDDGALGVKTVGRGDRVVFHPVSVVRAERDGVWISGLPERSRVITVGQGFVRAGEPVTPVDAADSPLQPVAPMPAIPTPETG